MPPELQKYYIWSPENNVEAMELLADAGFPNGLQFDTYVGWGWGEELMLIVKDDWAKIGVDMEVLMLEYATWEGHLWNRSSPALIFCPHGGSSNLRIHGGTFPPDMDAFGNVIDPVAEEVSSQLQNYQGQEDHEMRDDILTQEYFREIALCWDIYTPSPYPLLFWWPWLKNRHGVISLAWSLEVGSTLMYKYCWVDQDLKEQMTGSRD